MVSQSLSPYRRQPYLSSSRSPCREETNSRRPMPNLLQRTHPRSRLFCPGKTGSYPDLTLMRTLQQNIRLKSANSTIRILTPTVPPSPKHPPAASAPSAPNEHGQWAVFLIPETHALAASYTDLSWVFSKCPSTPHSFAGCEEKWNYR